MQQRSVVELCLLLLRLQCVFSQLLPPTAAVVSDEADHNSTTPVSKGEGPSARPPRTRKNSSDWLIPVFIICVSLCTLSMLIIIVYSFTSSAHKRRRKVSEECSTASHSTGHVPMKKVHKGQLKRSPQESASSTIETALVTVKKEEDKVIDNKSVRHGTIEFQSQYEVFQISDDNIRSADGSTFRCPTTPTSSMQ